MGSLYHYKQNDQREETIKLVYKGHIEPDSNSVITIKVVPENEYEGTFDDKKEQIVARFNNRNQLIKKSKLETEITSAIIQEIEKAKQSEVKIFIAQPPVRNKNVLLQLFKVVCLAQINTRTQYKNSFSPKQIKFQKKNYKVFACWKNLDDNLKEETFQQIQKDQIRQKYNDQ